MTKDPNENDETFVSSDVLETLVAALETLYDVDPVWHPAAETAMQWLETNLDRPLARPLWWTAGGVMPRRHNPRDHYLTDAESRAGIGR